MTNQNLPIIDEQLLNHGPSELVTEITSMLAQQLPELQTLINQAIAASDWQEAREQLHKLQGSCAYCGLVRLSPIVNELYLTIKDTQRVETALLTSFNQEVNAVIDALRQKGYGG